MIFGSPAPKWRQIQILKKVRLHDPPWSIRKCNKKNYLFFQPITNYSPAFENTKKQKNQTSTLEPPKMASLTSFYQIIEVNTDMKTAQRDLLKGEEKNFD